MENVRALAVRDSLSPGEKAIAPAAGIAVHQKREANLRSWRKVECELLRIEVDHIEIIFLPKWNEIESGSLRDSDRFSLVTIDDTCFADLRHRRFIPVTTRRGKSARTPLLERDLQRVAAPCLMRLIRLVERLVFHQHLNLKLAAAVKGAESRFDIGLDFPPPASSSSFHSR